MHKYTYMCVYIYIHIDRWVYGNIHTHIEICLHRYTCKQKLNYITCLKMTREMTLKANTGSSLFLLFPSFLVSR